MGFVNEQIVMQCRCCRSEFQIDFKQFDGYGSAMYLNKWLDLGQGPLEYDCQSHLAVMSLILLRGRSIMTLGHSCCV